MKKTDQELKQGSSGSAEKVSRRDFLRKTASAASGAVAATTVIAAARAGEVAAGAKAAVDKSMDHSAMSETMSHAATGHDTSKYGSMMFMEGHSMKPGQVIEPPGSPSPDEVKYKVFDVDVRIIEHEILPGIKSHMFAFNGQVPGPEFHVTEGDWIQVNFTNHTSFKNKNESIGAWYLAKDS